MIILIFFVGLWYFSLFSQTFFQHRYAAHGAFKMNKFWERFFFLFAYVTQGSSYMSPRAYAIMHRMHHAYTDTEQDPHSPSFSSNVFSMMWRTKKIFSDIVKGTMPVEKRFKKNLPQWKGFEKWANSVWSKLLWVALYILFFIVFANSLWWYLLMPFIVLMGPFHGVLINWFAHKYGYKNFVLKNTSQNLISVDIFMLGESYHNNHHKHPSSINFGSRWHEIDPIYPVILLFKWLGIIQVAAPSYTIEKKEAYE